MPECHLAQPVPAIVEGRSFITDLGWDISLDPLRLLNPSDTCFFWTLEFLLFYSTHHDWSNIKDSRLA